MKYKIAILPGDGIGPEIIAEAEKVLTCLQTEFGLPVEREHAPVGGAGYEALVTRCRPGRCNWPAIPTPSCSVRWAVPQWDGLDRALRPEQGLLGLRAGLELFANLRPAILYPQLAAASTLKPEIVSGLDILIVRELTGGIYFGKPRGIRIGRMVSAKDSIRWSTANRRSSASDAVPSRSRASARIACVPSTRPMCWSVPSCGGRSSRALAGKNTRMSN